MVVDVPNDPNILLTGLESEGVAPKDNPPKPVVESDIEASCVIVGEMFGENASVLDFAGEPLAKLP
jgi:hypothetical protein